MIALLIGVMILFNAIMGRLITHPFKVGDVIKIGSTDWAFCGYGSKAQGEYSKFKIHQPSALASLAKELGVVK